MTRTKLTGRAWLVIIGLAVVVTAASYLFGGTDHSTDDATALKACHRAVSTQLKSPASASWSDETVTGDRDGMMVEGTVDADNSFGAALRSSFSCSVTWTGDTAHAVVESLDGT